MRIAAVIEGVIFLVFGAAGIGEGIRLLNRVDPDSIKDVLGPGNYVIILGVILTVIGLAHLINTWVVQKRSSEAARTATPSWMSNPVPLYMLGAFALYVMLIYLLGFLVPTLVFFLLEFRVAGVLSWRRNVVLAAIATGAFYLIFIYYCNLVFPAGIVVKGLFD